nr:hypothetical protein 1 [Gammaproteobacteria bacterium]
MASNKTNLGSAPNPIDFFPNGKLHNEVAAAMNSSPSSLSTGISNGTYPFKNCRIKVGKNWIYDWDRCVKALMKKNHLSEISLSEG